MKSRGRDFEMGTLGGFPCFPAKDEVGASPTSSTRYVVLGAVLASALAGAGCVSNSGLLVILQNNQPVQDTTTMMCSAGSTPSATATGTGILDLETRFRG